MALGDEVHYLAVRDKVPDPKDIFFSVQYPGKPPIRLAGHFWYNAETVSAGKKCPAIVEFVPYRPRDGTMIADSKMYPWFAFNDYLCFRIDLQGRLSRSAHRVAAIHRHPLVRQMAEG